MRALAFALLLAACDGGAVDDAGLLSDAGSTDAGPSDAGCSASADEGAALPAPSLDPEAQRSATCAFDAMGEALASHRVICAGEEDHGVSESRIADAMLARYLALEHGLRWVAIEGTEASAARWDRYLETGDEAELEAGFGDSTGSLGDTTEAEDFVRALRALSMELPPGERMHVTGFDVAVQFDGTRESALAYVAEVEPSELDTWRAALRGSDWAAMGASAQALHDQLEERRAGYVASSSEEDWARARRDALNLRDGFLFIDYYARGDFGTGNATHREPGMVRNIEDLLTRTGDAPVLLIAHNLHCAKDTIIGVDAAGEDAPSFGTHLARSAWAEDYLVIAKLFGTGERLLPQGRSLVVSPFEPQPESPEGQLSTYTDAPALLISTGSDTLPFDDTLPSTLRGRRYVPRVQYDAFLFVRDATAVTLRE